MNAIPQLLRCDSSLNRKWIKIKLVGVKSNRSGIGSRVIVTAKTKADAPAPLLQMDELRSGGSYFSQNDLRMHFGLQDAAKVDMVEVRWVERAGGSTEKSGCEPAVCDSGGRQDSKRGRIETGQETRVVHFLLLFAASLSCPVLTTASVAGVLGEVKVTVNSAKCVFTRADYELSVEVSELTRARQVRRFRDKQLSRQPGNHGPKSHRQ